MDELEFRKRVYSNPEEPGQEALDAARDNPAWQQILEQSRQLNADINAVIKGVAVPVGLKERLLQVPEQARESAHVVGEIRKSTSYFQYYAIAASVLAAIAVTFSLNWGNQPMSAEVALGDEIIRHLYHEEAELNGVIDGSLTTRFAISTINEVMGNAGTTLNGGDYLQEMPVRFANPCLILPGFQSAHLILQTDQGPLNVIVINNSPVAREFSISDERFNGVVVPMERGNLILVGESEDNLNQYRNLFEDNVDWVI